MSHESNSAQRLFLEAVENVPCEQWDRFLDDACADDPALRNQVQRLLDAHRQVDSFMDKPAAGRTPAGAGVTGVTEQPGDTIGPYRLLEQVGEGGMGVVSMAEQTEPVARRVALKIIKPGMDTRQVIARFEAERQALAMMDHPNIASVLDAGTTETGRPYFVMELVKGLPITQFCDEQQLTPRERLELFLPVCQAVQHAHQKGVIHRDLKPSNILVARYDERAVPKVIDFGVAKAVSQRLTEKTMFTQYGQIVGTIEYMSPEQAQFNQLDVDTRSDVYSLGVILYELLTGETPFERQRLHSAAFDDLLRIIRDEEPPRPSTRLNSSDTLPSIAANRGMEPKKLSALLRGELDWIVMKALEKDRTRRYETVSALAADVQHHLNDEPVFACPPSMLYRLGKFARRHRPALTTAVGVTVALVAAVAVLIGSNIRERQNREELAVALDHEKRTVYFHRIALAYRELDHARRAREYLDACPQELRQWEWYHLNWLLNRSLQSFQGHTHRVVAVAWRPDGSRIASAGYDGTIREWDPDTGEVLGILPAQRDEDDEINWVTAVDYSPDGRRIAAATWKKVRIWNTHDRTVDLEIPVCRKDEYVLAVAFSPDGTRVASAGSDNHAIEVWDAVTGEPVLPPLEGHSDLVLSVAFSPDGRWIASGSDDKTIKQWDADTGHLERTIEAYDPPGNPQGHELGVSAVAFSRNSRLLASGSWDTTVQVWDVETGAHRLTIRGHSHWVSDIAFSLDGERLFSVSADTTGRIWDARNGKQLLILRGHLAPVFALALSPDGSRLVTGSWDKTLNLWDATPRDEVLTLRGHEGVVYSVVFSPDGKRVVSGSEDTTVRLWNLLTGREEMKLTGHTGEVNSVDVSPDGRWIASASLDGTACLWDLQTGMETARLTHPAAVHGVSFSPDGEWLATACDDRMARIWNAETGAEQRLLSGHSDAVVSIAWSSDGASIATGSNDGTVCLWAAEDGRTLRLFRGHSGPVDSVAIAPDGNQIVSTSAFSRDLTVGEVIFWDVESGEQLSMPLQPRQGPQFSVSYSPDGRRVVSAGANGALTLWDTETREQAMVLSAHQVEVSSAAFSPDGRLLVSGGHDHAIEVRETLGMDSGADTATTTPDAGAISELPL